MFKFSFSAEESEEEKHNLPTKEWYTAEQILPDEKYMCNIDPTNIKIFSCEDVTFKYISPESIINKLKDNTHNSNSILRAEKSNSDLNPAEYEGGLKIWECTKDLVNYLTKEKIPFSNKTVLDLGCGAGLLGIYALLKGSNVDFQDYNKEVIQHTTIPNISLNLTNYIHLVKTKKCNFFAGDWKSFTNINSGKYDYILTSETIYNPENYEKLLDILSNNLKECGSIYLAAKTYYFGVGGGIRQFEDLMNRKELFSSTVCWRLTDGVQREILKIQKI